MVLLLLLLMGLAAPHAAEPELYTASPLGALLHHAQQAEARGDFVASLDYLGAVEARILAGEEMPPADAVSALALLGTLRLHVGDETGAEAAFRLMVGRFPGETPCPPCPECPPPWTLHAPVPLTPDTSLRGGEGGLSSGGLDRDSLGSALRYAPLGAPQFAQDRRRAGLAWGGAQLVAGSLSVALFAHLATRRTAIEDGVAWDNRAERRSAVDDFQQTQLTLQLPLTFAFYGLWAGSVAEARRHR